MPGYFGEEKDPFLGEFDPSDPKERDWQETYNRFFLEAFHLLVKEQELDPEEQEQLLNTTQGQKEIGSRACKLFEKAWETKKQAPV